MPIQRLRSKVGFLFDAEGFGRELLARIFHEKCARRAETAALALPERLFGGNPGLTPLRGQKANCFLAPEILGRAEPALRAGSDAADIARLQPSCNIRVSEVPVINPGWASPEKARGF
jgi:hypothetical protein